MNLRFFAKPGAAKKPEIVVGLAVSERHDFRIGEETGDRPRELAPRKEQIAAQSKAVERR